MEEQGLKEMLARLDALRRQCMSRAGEDPEDRGKYWLYPAAGEEEIARYEKEAGRPYPPVYRAFLRIHNGWLGFWPDWSLAGVPRDDNVEMYEDIASNLEGIEDVATPEQIEELPEQEKKDASVVLLSNHTILGTDFNGGVLIFDRNRVGPDGEPEVAWVEDVMHVERRWANFAELLQDAVRGAENELAELRGR